MKDLTNIKFWLFDLDNTLYDGATKVFDQVDKKEKAKKAKETTNGPSEKNLDPQTHKNLQKSYAEFDKVAAALPQVKGLGELSDLELDKLAVEAEESYKNLMDLGMNSESRHAGKMFEVAQTMMKNAIEAKNAKADKKLRMIELQLKKQRVDQWEQKAGGSTDDFIEGEGYIVGDRNKLLDQIIQKVEENDKNNKEDK